MRNPLTFKSESFARLAACRDINLGLARKGGHFYFRAESSLGEVDWQFVKNIIAVPDEELVL